MRHVTSWLIGFGVMTGLGAFSATSWAQPDRDHRIPPPPPGDHDHDRDHDRRLPPPGEGPREAPPPPREERMAARAGFEWMPGRWDWRNGKWEWMAGRWEHEHPGKHWSVGRWEHQGDRWAFVEGGWIDVGAPPPPGPGTGAPLPPPPPGENYPPEPDHHHHEWKLDRPMVSSYWPTKGKIGSRVVIRGRNFPADTAVLWGGAQVNGAKVTPDEIVAIVPTGATSSTLALHVGHHDLIVGNYEIADYDAAAEAQRLADEARRRAEQDWAARQGQIARDRTVRLAAFDQQRQQLDASREQRREDRLRELRGRWEAAFLADPDTQAELTLHAQRVADLARMKEVAELEDNGKLVVRIGVAASREDQRHNDRMTALHDTFGRKP